MTPEQQRKILEAAAKACGITYLISGEVCDPEHGNYYWNPITNSADTAGMCAKLEIDTFWWNGEVECVVDGVEELEKAKHDGTPEGKEAAWRLAASMVAAKIGGYEE